jgi:hypothetical protein
LKLPAQLDEGAAHAVAGENLDVSGVGLPLGGKRRHHRGDGGDSREQPSGHAPSSAVAEWTGPVAHKLA